MEQKTVSNKTWRGHALIIAFGITMLVLLLAGGAGAVTSVSSCGTISSPGEYVLTTSINNAYTCINIVSSDVILDGAGYTINGMNTAGTYGVFVHSISNSSTPLSNVSVKNLVLTNWYTGIYLLLSSNSTLSGNNASNNDNGIYLDTSSGNNLTGNNANSNGNYGIFLGSSSSNNLTANNASNNGLGSIGIFLESSSSNDLTGNNASNNFDGIYLYSSSNNNLTGNNANSNNGILCPNCTLGNNAGIVLDSSSSNNLTNNNANSNRFDGIDMYSSSNNNLTGNNASNNTFKFGILLASSINNTLASNNASNNYDGIEFDYSSNNILTNNTANSNTDSGIDLGYSTNSSNNNNILTGNIINSNNHGIFLYFSGNNTLTSNNASSNSADGIELVVSKNNILAGNNASISGISLSTSNSNTLIGNDASAGGIIITSSSNNTVSGNNASTGGISLSSSNSNNLSENDASIEIDFSSNNTLNMNNGGFFGIFLYYSSNNMLSGNNVVASTPPFFPNASIIPGILLEYSNNNMLIGNNISNFSNFFIPRSIAAKFGIFIDSSSGNNLSSNVISNNTHGILLYNSSNNNLTNNNVSNNNYGINITSSSNNTIYNNYFSNSLNAADDSNNTWNITKQPGTNILGGPYLGGNFWSDYAGNDTDGDRLGDTLIPYNSSGNILNGGDYLPLTLTLGVTLSASANSTVTTNTSGTGTSISNPVVTDVTTPNAGTISIQEMSVAQTPPTGFFFIGQQVNITAPPANASSPLVIVFTINSSQIPAGQNQNTIQIFKKGVLVPPCTGSPATASPDPCISNRATLSNGDVEITVLTSTASNWLFASPAPQQEIQIIITNVQGLVTSGVLIQGQGNSLIAKLNAATKNLNNGNTNVAINELHAFINEVQADIRAGKLTPAQGQPLIDAANAIIAQI